MRQALAALAVVLLVSACTSKVELMKRYQAVDPTEVKDAGRRIEVGLHSIAVPSGSEKKTVFDLTDRGQEAYIAAIAKLRSDDPGAFRDDLLKGFKPAGKLGGDLTRVGRRLVLTARDTAFFPGDRLERLDVTLTLDQKEPARFVSWNRYEDEFGSVDLGSVTLTKGESLSAEISLAPPQIKELTSAAFTPTISRDLKEDLAVSQRFTKFAGELNATEMHIQRQGITGIDMIGTSTLDVVMDLVAQKAIQSSLTARPHMVHHFALGTEKGSDRKRPKLTSGVIVAPTTACDITAKMTVVYWVRHILSGADTVIEGDDTVQYIKGGYDEDVVVFPASEIGRDFFVLYFKAQGTGGAGRIVRIQESPGVRPSDLEFDTMDDARAFLTWLLGRAEGVPDDRLVPLGELGARLVVGNNSTNLTGGEARRLYAGGLSRGECPAGSAK